MLTWEDDVEVHALRKRGWSIAAIARHTGRDRKTVRDYLSGKRTPGVRARPGPDLFEPFVDYVTARLTEDPHLWARTLLDELEQVTQLRGSVRDLANAPYVGVPTGEVPIHRHAVREHISVDDRRVEKVAE